jgi:carboxyl-terminal processing protease
MNVRISFNLLCASFILLCLLQGIHARAQSGKPTPGNVFEFMRPSFEVMEFIAESKFTPDWKTSGERLSTELKGMNIISAASTNPKPSAIQQEQYFKSPDGTITIANFISDNGDVLYEQWRNELKELGLKSDIRNEEGGSVFLRVKTTTNSAVGALFYTGRNLFRIVIQLPFPVETYEALDSSSVAIIRTKYEMLHKMLEAIARTYVLPQEFVLYPSKTLTSEQRLYGLIQFWTEVKYNFAFFDQVPHINWDHVLAEYLPIIEKEQTTEEYYDNLARMCALLKDGHTNIYKPRWIESTIAQPPLQLTNIQNKAIVSNCDQSLKDVIPIGSEIISVDGIPTQQYLSQQIFPLISSSTEHILYDNGIRTLLHGKVGTPVNIEYKTAAGKKMQQSLTRSAINQVTWVRTAAKSMMFEFKRMPGKIAYVAINTFGNNKVVEEFQNHIDSINSCDRLIIDLRSNGGGSSTNAYDIIEHLTEKPFTTSKWRTREHRPAFKAWGSFRVDNFRNAARSKKQPLNDWDLMTIEFYKGNQWYSEAPTTIRPTTNKKITIPIVVLIGHKTASAAEDFLIALENTKRATTIGSKTFGSTGQPLSFKLPGGGSARICTKRDEYPDGRQFVGFGVKPDIEIEDSVTDLISENDRVLKNAIEIVTAMKK